MLYPDDLTETVSAGADTFSRSALGHRALTESLSATRYSVLKSRHATGRRLRSDAVLLLLEPPTEEDGGHQHQHTRALVLDGLEAATAVVVVLPKWFGAPDAMHPSHVEHVVHLGGDEVEVSLKAAWHAGSLVEVPC